MYFDELDLNDNVLDALYDMRFDTCTPVQEKCIPEILEGHDVLGVAQTGTGKTAAYLLPVLSKLDDGGYPKDAINSVIMSPTRELAQQIDQAMQGFGYYLQGVSSVAVYGGNDGNRYDQELRSLRMGADVVIATPGRLISHISLGNVDLSKVSFFILDEADRMLDMGFSDDIKTIAAKLPKTCQTIMFSATMPEKIEELAKTLLKNPVEIKLAVSKPAEKIKQEAYVCYETQKMTIIKDIFKAGDLKRVIVFSGSKFKVKQLAASLQQIGVNCGAMHSDLEQAERDDVMFKFKSGQYDVLVATDIVAAALRSAACCPAVAAALRSAACCLAEAAARCCVAFFPDARLACLACACEKSGRGLSVGGSWRCSFRPRRFRRYRVCCFFRLRLSSSAC